MIRTLQLNLATIFIFAVFYYILARTGGDHFNGIDSNVTFMDTFYFACTIQSTVGFGDIYPKSSMARTLVMLQQGMLIVGVVDLLNTTATTAAVNAVNVVNVVPNKINVGLK